MVECNLPGDPIREEMHAQTEGDEDYAWTSGEPRCGIPATDAFEDKAAQGGRGRLWAEAEKSEDCVDTDNLGNEVEKADGGWRRGQRKQTAEKNLYRRSTVGAAGADESTLEDSNRLGANQTGGGSPDDAPDQPWEDAGSGTDDGGDRDDE